MSGITIQPIGEVHSPYKTPGNMPIQGVFGSDVEAWIELKEEYVSGLKGLEGFSHAIILYYFHLSQREDLQAMPFLERVKHGIFAIRSPHRPNHLGFSIIKINSIAGNKIHFSQVDILDGTPVLDIKPYVKYFDQRDNVKSGWIDKHFKDGKIPNSTIIGEKNQR